MTRARALVGVASGRRTKWAVLVFWLIILAVLGPLAGKLTGAEKNNAQSWLPGSAESTKVLALQSRFQSPNIFTGVVVYDRPSGLTSADRAKIAADARQFSGVPGVVHSQQAGPFFAKDGQAAETLVPINLGKKGWNGAGDRGQQAAHYRQGQFAAGCPSTSPARSVTPPTRPTRSRASTARCCTPRWRSSSCCC